MIDLGAGLDPFTVSLRSPDGTRAVQNRVCKGRPVPGGGYSAWKLMGVCRWPLKIGPKKIEEKIEFGAKKIDFCKNW